jgi:hypothetical protein
MLDIAIGIHIHNIACVFVVRMLKFFKAFKKGSIKPGIIIDPIV